MATHGKINPREVWKAVYLDNPRVFETERRSGDSGIFSRYADRCIVFQKADAGTDCGAGICPGRKSGRVWNTGTDIFLLQYPGLYGDADFKDYEEEKVGNELFGYVAAGNNRDGLALRAAGYLMEASKKAKRILLVLTDANPMDDQNIGEGAFYTNKEYTD